MSATLRVLAALLVVAAAPMPVAAQRPVTLFVPAFDGPDSLGRNVATILNLQVWQTLRKAPFPNPSNLHFGDGLVVWDDAPLSPQSHDRAERVGRDSDADLVLWGKARRYGDGVVVQSYLTMPAGARLRLWKVRVPAASGASIGIDVPRLRYEFGPIALTRAVVDSYSSPGALKLYTSPTSTEAVGVVGGAFVALEQGANVARVESGGKRGWIHLPSLSGSRSEVVDFVGAMIRLLRADWDGAARLFQNVITNPRAPASLKVDAHLCRGAALERSGSVGAAEIRHAFELNPYDRTVVSYLLMSQIATLMRTPASDPGRGQILSTARGLVASKRYLFPSDDPWLKRVTDVLARPQ